MAQQFTELLTEGDGGSRTVTPPALTGSTALISRRLKALAEAERHEEPDLVRHSAMEAMLALGAYVAQLDLDARTVVSLNGHRK